MSILNSFRSPCCMASCTGQQPALMSIWLTLYPSHSSTLTHNTDLDIKAYMQYLRVCIGVQHSPLLLSVWPLTPVADSDPEEPRRSPWFPSTLHLLLYTTRALCGAASSPQRPGHLHQHFQNIQVSHMHVNNIILIQHEGTPHFWFGLSYFFLLLFVAHTESSGSF